MASRFFVDVTPLKQSPDFRRLWLGEGISTFGGYMAAYAVMYQIYSITQSSLAVGAAGLFIAIPSLLFVLFAGSLGDSFDRRKLVLSTTIGQIALASIYFIQSSLQNEQVWILYGLLAMQSLLTSINAPARATFMPRLLPKNQFRSAAVLNMVFMTFCGVLGPVTAGFITSLWSMNINYLINALSYIAALYGVFRLPAMLPEGGAVKPSVGMIAEGMKFIVKNQRIKGAFFTDMSVTLLGTSTALFPAITALYFSDDPTILGYFMAAPALGGFLGSICSGQLTKVKREGRAVIILAFSYAVSIMCFGLSVDSVIFLPLFFLMLSGAADSLMVVLNQTIVVHTTPDHLRSRVNSVEYLLGFGGPQLGDFRAGAVGTALSPRGATMLGGMTSILAVGAIYLLLPSYRTFHVEKEVENEAEQAT
ncbi:MFS transporter [Alkalihalobacillus sp. FSL R5-0424]